MLSEPYPFYAVQVPLETDSSLIPVVSTAALPTDNRRPQIPPVPSQGSLGAGPKDLQDSGEASQGSLDNVMNHYNRLIATNRHH